MPDTTCATATFGFVDTNVLLHFPPIDQINWTDLLGARKIILVITSVVIRELNKHKDAPISPKLRDRATSILRRLYEYSEQEGVVEVRDNVELQFHTHEPLLNFASEGLAREIPDDYLVATVLGFSRKFPKLKVAVITNDLGLKLKAQAYGIRTLRPPDDMRLPDEVDPGHKRIRELEERVRLLQLQIPDLKLVFRSKEDRIHYILKADINLTPEVLNWRLTRLRKKFPKMVKPNWYSGADSQAGTIPPSGFDDYNRALDLFFSDYERYLPRLQNYFNQKRRTIQLNIWAFNIGSCPAKDADIFMRFPDDIDVFTKLPGRPEMPRPPETPGSRAEAKGSVGLNTIMWSGAHFVTQPSFDQQLSGVQYVPGLDARTSRVTVEDNVVRMHVAEAKHKLLTSVDTIYVMFRSHAQAHSFTVDYDIYCANIPDMQAGKLHVIVERRA